jgi:hypothetical protein
MKHLRGLVVGFFFFAGIAEAQAQVFYPGTLDYGSYTISRSVGLTYRRHHHSLWGFLGGTYGFGYGSGLYTSYSVYSVIPPPVTVIVQPRPVVVLQQVRDELAGIDLDLQPQGPPPPIKKKPEPKPIPKEEVIPPPKPPKVEPKPPPEPPPPVVEPADPLERLIKQGKEAFAAQEYGSAALRFRQAIATEPKQALPYFFLAQAQFALGKYPEAVAAIRDGMRRQPNWPESSFHPRKDLYAGNELDFLAYLKRLRKVREENPDNPTFLFLLAYQLWFDHQEIEARPIFVQARPLTPEADRTFIDQFLKVKAPPLAAK